MTYTLTPRRLPAFIALLLGAVLAGSALAATSYTAVDTGADGCRYTKMNGKGQFTGYCNAGSRYVCFLTEAGGRSVHGLDQPLEVSLQIPQSLNPQGVLVGDALQSDWPGYRGWIQAPGQAPVLLGTLGGNFSTATDINVKGLVVGFSRESNGNVRGFWVEPGTTELHPMASSGHGDQLARVNGNGTVVGYTFEGGGAFYAKPPYDKLVFLDTLGGAVITATSLNDLGDIVGFASNPAGVLRAYIGKVGSTRITELKTLAGQPALAGDINKAGLIVGQYVRQSDRAWVAFSCTGDCSDWVDLNKVTTGLPAGVLLNDARDVNNRGQIGATGSDGRTYLLTPQ
jgi:uncharacterized membrane protein